MGSLKVKPGQNVKDAASSNTNTNADDTSHPARDDDEVNVDNVNVRALDIISRIHSNYAPKMREIQIQTAMKVEVELSNQQASTTRKCSKNGARTTSILRV